MEELGMKRGVKALWKTIGWHGNLPCFAAIPVSDMASFFSQDYLAGNLVDAMMDLLSVRLSTSAESISESALVVNTTFAQFIWLLLPDKNGRQLIAAHPAAHKYLKKYGSWFCSPDHTHLYFVLHRPPDHWTACGIDFEKKHIRYGDSLRWQRPEDFFRALESWTTDQFPDAKFTVTKDLPCASQTDGYNCPIISVNTMAHEALGDILWTPETAKAMRMKAFCDISEHVLSAKHISTLLRRMPDTNDVAESILAANPDINDVRMDECASFDPEVTAELAVTTTAATEALTGSLVDELQPPSGHGVLKRTADASGSDDKRAKKIAKTSEPSARSGSIHSFFDRRPTVPTIARAKSIKHAPSEPTSSVVGISQSATAARKQRDAIKSGKFQASAVRTHNFREKCRGYDSGACFEDTASQVQCSTCKVWKKMKEPYSATRFKEHIDAGKCSAPPAIDLNKRTLDQFSLVKQRPKVNNLSHSKVSRPCPGLTRAFDLAVGNYLDRTVSAGGGAHAVNHYSDKIFDQKFIDLTQVQKDAVRIACAHDYIWRNDTSPGIIACFATGLVPCLKTVDIDPDAATTPPCDSCRLVSTTKSFKNAIHREAQSRTLSHHERAKIAIRTHLFLNTWRKFLEKGGYPEARHFISKEAFDIAQILINGLLGLIIIHRDHLGDIPCPLLPWFNASEPNEHCFSGLRDMTPDMTMQQAIVLYQVATEPTVIVTVAF
ncbi:hypothetical protein B0H10DRAFT_2449660 [Mycena sp. CBHHK59/15]|nr:hypothetical protein B0H10DRAFT_2449660 [Mycena sp. CBHHK59/15]